MRLAAWRRAVWILALTSLCTAARAGGPYVVDDASIGRPGECQVESWLSFAGNGDFIGLAQPACVVRIGVPVELTTVWQRSRADDAWSTFIGVQGKTILAPMDGRNVALALSVGTLLDVSIGTSALTYVNLPVTVKAGEHFRINLNSGWAYDGILDHHHFTWGGGFEWDFAKSLTLIGEVFGQTGHLSEPRMQAGLRHAATDKVDLDLIYGENITGENARWVTAGLTVRF